MRISVDEEEDEWDTMKEIDNTVKEDFISEENKS